MRDFAVAAALAAAAFGPRAARVDDPPEHGGVLVAAAVVSALMRRARLSGAAREEARGLTRCAACARGRGSSCSRLPRALCASRPSACRVSGPTRGSRVAIVGHTFGGDSRRRPPAPSQPPRMLPRVGVESSVREQRGRSALVLGARRQAGSAVPAAYAAGGGVLLAVRRTRLRRARRLQPDAGLHIAGSCAPTACYCFCRCSGCGASPARSTKVGGGWCRGARCRRSRWRPTISPPSRSSPEAVWLLARSTRDAGTWGTVAIPAAVGVALLPLLAFQNAHVRPSLDRRVHDPPRDLRGLPAGPRRTDLDAVHPSRWNRRARAAGDRRTGMLARDPERRRAAIVPLRAARRPDRTAALGRCRRDELRHHRNSGSSWRSRSD